ncbi:MAG: hypothetical protein MZW92_63370 [Comamonadaceae bacterium]|nr:hypothetical protein [Comamonadaceae bacterium]
MAPLDVAAWYGSLLALLDQRLHLVGGDDARAGDDLALAVGLQRRELQVQEAVGRGAEQRQREASAGVDAAELPALAGRLTNWRVDEARARRRSAAGLRRRWRRSCRRR